jgi:calcineurin-like phosphoesterase family protein
MRKGLNMTIWFTSDLHHSHKSIINFTARPQETVEEMNEAIVKTINDMVKPGDTLYHAGDLSFSKKDEYIYEFLNQIKCQNIYLILGNHDQLFRSYQNQKKLIENCPNVRGIHERLRIKIDKVDITLDHYPGRSWYKSCYGAWQLHGHTHGSVPMYGRSMDVGWDSPHLTGSPLHRPVSFNELYEFMKDIEPIKEFAE